MCEVALSLCSHHQEVPQIAHVAARLIVDGRFLSIAIEAAADLEVPVGRPSPLEDTLDVLELLLVALGIAERLVCPSKDPFATIPARVDVLRAAVDL